MFGGRCAFQVRNFWRADRLLIPSELGARAILNREIYSNYQKARIRYDRGADGMMSER